MFKLTKTKKGETGEEHIQKHAVTSSRIVHKGFALAGQTVYCDFYGN
jgi:hypothetical protein